MSVLTPRTIVRIIGMDTADLTPVPIGALLMQRGLIDAKDIDKALAFQRQFKGRFGAILVRIGAISEDALLPVLASQLQLKLMGAGDLPVDAGAIHSAVQASGLSQAWFQDQRVLVWFGADGLVQCASRNPIDSNIQETLATAFPAQKLVWAFARTQDLESTLRLIEDPADNAPQDEVAHLRELAEEAPVVELVNNLLSQAIDAAGTAAPALGRQWRVSRGRYQGRRHRRIGSERDSQLSIQRTGPRVVRTTGGEEREVRAELHQYSLRHGVPSPAARSRR